MKLDALMPALSANLDPVFVVDKANKIVYASKAAKALLQLKPKDIGTLVLCDRLTMAVCSPECKVIHAIEKQKELRFDEVPASIAIDGKSAKLRVAAKIIPISNGAIVTIRDTSAELLVQAKYHKLSEMLKEKDEELKDLAEELKHARRRR